MHLRALDQVLSHAGRALCGLLAGPEDGDRHRARDGGRPLPLPQAGLLVPPDALQLLLHRHARPAALGQAQLLHGAARPLLQTDAHMKRAGSEWAPGTGKRARGAGVCLFRINCGGTEGCKVASEQRSGPFST